MELFIFEHHGHEGKVGTKERGMCALIRRLNDVGHNTSRVCLDKVQAYVPVII